MERTGRGGGGVLQPSNTQHHPILDVPNWIGYYRTLKIHPMKSGRLRYLIFIMLYKQKMNFLSMNVPVRLTPTQCLLLNLR